MKPYLLYPVLEQLIVSPFCTTFQLAKQAGLSEKTVRTYLKQADALLAAFSLTLTRKPGCGITLSGSRENMMKLQTYLLDEKTRCPLILPRERVSYILYSLLRFSRPLRMFQLEETLHISRSSLYADIRKAEQWLRTYQLSISHTRSGIQILQGEKRIRKALAQLVNELHEARTITFHKPLNDFVEACFSDNTVKRNILLYIRQFEVCSFLQLNQADKEYVSVLYYIALDRISRGNHVHMHSPNPLQKTALFQQLMHLRKEIEHHLQQTIPEEELSYALSVLLTSKNTNTGLLQTPEIQAACKEILRRFTPPIYARYPKIDSDTFEKRLFQHLSNVLEKSVYYYEYDNPLKDAMKAKFPIPYQMASSMKEIVQDICGLQLPEDEISYITLHIAAALQYTLQPLEAVFLYEHRYSELIFSLRLLQTHIQEVKIQRVIRWQEVSEPDSWMHYPVIFSTFPLTVPPSVHWYQIPMLPDQTFLQRLRDDIQSLFNHQNHF
ncbi:PRD domain-containing protein [[Clostridium] innocuum]|nr:PRD domain-containing protein [[Clostridium] innocuum]